MPHHPPRSRGSPQEEHPPRPHDSLVEPLFAALRAEGAEPRRGRSGCALLAAGVLALLVAAPSPRSSPAQSAAQAQSAAAKSPVARTLPPSDVRAVHAAGQTFVTWEERPELHGESYKVYRAAFPITDVRAPGVVDLGFQTWENSGELYSDRVLDPNGCEEGVWSCGRENKPLPCFRPRYVERHWIPDGAGGAREVPHGQGLLVWTPACADFPDQGCSSPAGTFWYGVTTVDEFGLENPFVGPASRAAVLEGIADPLPVEVPRAFLDCSSPEYCPHESDGDENPLPPGVHVFIQYMDLRAFNPTFAAPNPLNCWWGEDPGVLRVQRARQYAFTYTVAEPDPALAGCAPPYPLVVDLHSHGGTAKAQLYGKGGAEAYAEGCALLLQPLDVGETWWYGFSASYDYRSAQEDCPTEPCAGIDDEFPPLPPYERVPDSGPIVNFTEARVLRMVYDLLRAPLPGFSVDAERIYVQGTSMGASGALSLALRYPDVFAAAAAGKPMTDFEAYLSGVAPHPNKDLRHELPLRWGADPVLALESGLPLLSIANTGPADWADHLAPFDGLPVYAWMDHLSQLASPAWAALDNAPLGVRAGFADDVLPYPTQGLPFFEAGGMGDLGRAWGGVIGCEGHGGSAFGGMPPALAASAANPSPAPFSDYRVAKSETVPGFSQLSGGHYPTPPVACCSAPCEPAGPFDYYQDLIWSSSWYDWDREHGPPVDLPLSWEISLRWTGAFAPPPTVTITPRRLQQFEVVPGADYSWWNVELGTGTLVQPPSPAVVLPSGLIQLPAVELTPPGNRLVLVRLP